MPYQAPDTAMKRGTGEAIPSLSHFLTDTAAQVVMIYIEAVLDHNIGITSTITGVAQDAQIPHTEVIAIDPALTHHMDQTTHH